MNRTVSTNTRKLQAAFALLLLCVVIVGAVVLSRPKTAKMTMVAATTQVSTQGATGTVSHSSTATLYRDGTYSSTTSYTSPGGLENLHVSLTLASNTVTASTVTSGANDPTAASYQSIFISGYKQYVIGKKITDIHLKNVSGSSLTPQGFNDALKQIEHQAEA
jgi:hypothetical protein